MSKITVMAISRCSGIAYILIVNSFTYAMFAIVICLSTNILEERMGIVTHFSFKRELEKTAEGLVKEETISLQFFVFSIAVSLVILNRKGKLFAIYN